MGVMGYMCYFKGKSLDEVTQEECAGEQRLFLKDALFPISLGQ